MVTMPRDRLRGLAVGRSRRAHGSVRAVVALDVLFMVAAAGCASSDESSAVGDSSPVVTSLPVSITGNAASTTADYPNDLMQACRRAGSDYLAIPIAAFVNPSNNSNVVCWADGHVAKSPPPLPGGIARPDFDRLVFTATTDGTFVKFVAAGYRDRFNVAPPCQQAALPVTTADCK